MPASIHRHPPPGSYQPRVHHVDEQPGLGTKLKRTLRTLRHNSKTSSTPSDAIVAISSGGSDSDSSCKMSRASCQRELDCSSAFTASTALELGRETGAPTQSAGDAASRLDDCVTTTANIISDDGEKGAEATSRNSARVLPTQADCKTVPLPESPASQQQHDTMNVALSTSPAERCSGSQQTNWTATAAQFDDAPHAALEFGTETDALTQSPDDVTWSTADVINDDGENAEADDGNAMRVLPTHAHCNTVPLPPKTSPGPPGLLQQYSTMNVALSTSPTEVCCGSEETGSTAADDDAETGRQDDSDFSTYEQLRRQRHSSGDGLDAFGYAKLIQQRQRARDSMISSASYESIPSSTLMMRYVMSYAPNDSVPRYMPMPYRAAAAASTTRDVENDDNVSTSSRTTDDYMLPS